jgi:hypothetical protein
MNSLAKGALLSVLALSLVAPELARATVDPEKSRVENPLFGYTHLMPSPFTLPAGRLLLGTEFALGLTDFFQVGTNVIRDVYKVFNANAKLALLDYQEYALALTLGFETYNLNDIHASNPDIRVTSWQPGMVNALALLPDLALFFGGNLNLSKTTLTNAGIQTSGYVTGAVGQADLSWAYNTKKHSVGNVLSGGVTYDFTYDVFGFGASHHWPGFHIGLHYYPNASQYKVQPIVMGGAAVEL